MLIWLRYYRDIVGEKMKYAFYKFMMIFILLILLCSSIASGQYVITNKDYVYSMDFVVDRYDNVVLEKAGVIRGQTTHFPPINISTGYFVVISSAEDERLFIGNVGISFTVLTEPEGYIMLQNVSYNLRLPYFETAKKIDLYHFDKIILSIELCNYNKKCELGETFLYCPTDCARGAPDKFCIPDKDAVCDPDCAEGVDPDCAVTKIECGDKICDASESYKSCPKDCPSGRRDNYCDGIKDNICDPDCRSEQDVDCPAVKPITKKAPSLDKIIPLLIYGLIVVIIIIGILVYLRKKQPQQKPKQYRK